MIHQPLGGARGQASDIRIHADWITKTKTKLNNILSENTGQSFEKVEEDTDRDNFMTADEAKQYGLVDEVIRR
jgi:ATP-dependent Clp protease, proteolytic subunit ClpP